MWCWRILYLDYENCKFREKLVDKLVEDCNEETDGNEIIYNGYENVCNSSTIYIVLFVIALLIVIGISSAYFYFHWYLKKSDAVLILLILMLILKQWFIKHIHITEINMKSRT